MKRTRKYFEALVSTGQEITVTIHPGCSFSRTGKLIRFDFELWEAIVITDETTGKHEFAKIEYCEFLICQPKRHEDLREAPGPNPK